MTKKFPCGAEKIKTLISINILVVIVLKNRGRKAAKFLGGKNLILVQKQKNTVLVSKLSRRN